MVQPPGDAEGYKLAFEEGKKAVAEQAATLKEVRDRVGTMVSAAALVAGLAATLSFNSARIGRVGGWGATAAVAATLGFGAIAFSAVMIWRPFRGTFTMDAGVIVGSYVEGQPPSSITELHRELALHLGVHSEYNRDLLGHRLNWFVLGLWGFLIEIGGLMVVLWDVAA